MSQILNREIMEALRANAQISPELRRLGINARKAAEFLKSLGHSSQT